MGLHLASMCQWLASIEKSGCHSLGSHTSLLRLYITSCLKTSRERKVCESECLGAGVKTGVLAFPTKKPCSCFLLNIHNFHMAVISHYVISLSTSLMALGFFLSLPFRKVWVCLCAVLPGCYQTQHVAGTPQVPPARYTGLPPLVWGKCYHTRCLTNPARGVRGCLTPGQGRVTSKGALSRGRTL